MVEQIEELRPELQRDALPDLVRLMNDTSQLFVPGPRNRFRPAVPNAPSAGLANEPVLNHRPKISPPSRATTTSGRCAPPPTPARSAGIVTVSGRPDSKREMPEICQP